MKRTLPICLLLAACKTEAPPAEQAAAERVPALEQASPGEAVAQGEQTPTAPTDATRPEQPPGEATLGPSVPASCKVEQLYAGKHPTKLAVDATHVYFIQDAQLFRIPRASGEAQLLLGQVEYEQPLLDGDDLFVCRRGKQFDVDMLRVAKDGSKTQTLASAAACKLALVGDWLYFPTLLDGYKPALARIPKRGGKSSLLSAAERPIAEIVGDGSQVYFTTESDDLSRYDPRKDSTTVLLTERHGMRQLGITDTHLVWLEYANLMRLPKSGGTQAAVVANFQDALSFASSGADLYWASVADSGWRRLSGDETTMRSFSNPNQGGSSSIVVEGKRVFWNVFAERGGIFTLDTTRCGDDVLVPSPTMRGIVGPEEEDELRFGYAEAGEVVVEVDDLSSDEQQALQQLATRYETPRLPPDAKDLPPRFVLGDPYRVATTAGVFDGALAGFELGYGGEGLHFYLVLRIPDQRASAALASKPTGPKLGPLRAGEPEPEPERYLAAVRAAFAAAELDGERITVDALEVVRGKFPAPHVALIAVTLEPESNDEDEPNLGYWSALLLGDATGKISGEVHGAEDRLERFTIQQLVDTDADGIDEALIERSYYEGRHDLLLHWNGDSASTYTLAGDGA